MTITQQLPMSHFQQHNINDIDEGSTIRKRHSTRSAGGSRCSKKPQNFQNLTGITEFFAEDQPYSSYYSNEKCDEGAVASFDQNGPFQNAHQRQSANARERSRTFHVNAAFNALRTLIPTKPPNRKLSKIETLHLAISYISHLSTLLSEDSGDSSDYDPSPNVAPQTNNAFYKNSYPHSDYILQSEPNISMSERNSVLETNVNEGPDLVEAPKLSRALESKYCTFCAFHNPTPSSSSS